MNILLLGATGFIGSAVAVRLLEVGHEVTGLARDPLKFRSRLRPLKWVTGDLSQLCQVSDWIPLLANIDIVINCAGALQDGLRDDLAASQERAMIALYAAARRIGVRLVVQISANTTGAGAETAFLRTKKAADEALAASGLDHAILRPALVIGRNAHGGTALLRALAAFPGAIPLAYADSQVATVSLEDVTRYVCRAIDGEIPANRDYALAATDIHSLRDLVAMHRRWLGLPEVPAVAMPAISARLTGVIADAAGWLGWRSPLRSTAMAVMAGGVAANTSGKPDAPLEGAAVTLARNPSGIQDLWAARLYLLKPVIILLLAGFWLASGLIPLLDMGRAAAYLAPHVGATAATALTFFTCALDIGLGLAVAFRPWARPALFGMLAVSCAYLLSGTLLAPGLWLDPLGPYVKVLPSMGLTAVALAILEER